ncbi:MAG: cytochrome c [Hyphomicrobiaceae bacterium]
MATVPSRRESTVKGYNTPTFAGGQPLGRLCVVVALTLIACIGGGAVSTLAHVGATGVVGERMAAMTSMKKIMKELAAMVRGERALSTKRVADHAGTLRQQALAIPGLFPKGSNIHPSEARALIWQEFETFSGYAYDMARAAEVLAQSVQRPLPPIDGVTQKAPNLDFRAAFAAIGGTCGGCHKRFTDKK